MKVEKKLQLKLKDEEIDRNKKNLEILHEVNKCKAAIYKLWKRKWKIEISYHSQEHDVQQNDYSRNEDYLPSFKYII